MWIIEIRREAGGGYRIVVPNEISRHVLMQDHHYDFDCPKKKRKLVHNLTQHIRASRRASGVGICTCTYLCNRVFVLRTCMHDPYLMYGDT